MKNYALALLTLVLGTLTSHAIEPRSGRWVSVIKTWGEVAGGANLHITSGGRVTGRGIRANGDITRFNGKINPDGTFLITETALGRRFEFKGSLSSPSMLSQNDGISRNFSAVKVTQTSKAGAYYGTYTGGYPWAVIASPSSDLRAFVYFGGKFVKLKGLLLRSRIIISRGSNVEIKGVIRNGRISGKGTDGQGEYSFHGSLL